MTSTARKHDDLLGVTDGTAAPALDPDAADLPIGNPDGTEYATRGARGHKSARPHLRMVAPLRPERASRGVFALLVTGLLGIGMVLILVINTSLAQGAFTVSELQGQQAELAQREQALGEQLAAAAAPDRLEAQARALGMVPSENPVFLNVANGRVLGRPKPAVGPRSVTPRLLTPADATVTEAVDNGAADLPVSPGADYDPAAVDAAAAQAAAAAATAGDSGLDASASQPVPLDPSAAQAATTDTKAAKAADNTGKAKVAGKKKKVTENSLWQDATVIDMTGQLSSGDAGLVAVPVE
ncbi:MAG: hypothetical protein GC156_12210 [Actinomycetales bacterium]|nr:hypothetical protein [Actinomycetales bacterium]